MRSIDGIKDLKDITTLLLYLYMEEGKTVTYNNGLTDMRIRMDSNFNIWGTNLKFPDLPDMNFNEQMTVPYMLGIINILKNTDPVEFPGSCESRWNEIHAQVGTMMTLNRYKFKLPRAKKAEANGKEINND